MPRCKAVTQTGKKCKHNAAEHCDGFCKAHFKKEVESLQNTVMTEGDETYDGSTVVQDTEDDITLMDHVNDDDTQSQNTESQNTETKSHTTEPLSFVAVKEISDEIAKQQKIIQEAKSMLKMLKEKQKRHCDMNKIITRAKMLYYKEYKNHEEIMNFLRPKLESAGLLLTKTVIVKRQEVIKEIIPWQYVKAYTDSVFETRSEEEKQEWYKKVVIIH